MKLRRYKLWVTAIIFAAILAGIVEFSGWSEFAKDRVSNIPILGWFTNLLPARVSDFLITKHPGLTSFLPISFVFYGLANTPVIKKSLIKIWPDTPYYLDTHLTKDTNNDLDAFAPDQDFMGREEAPPLLQGRMLS